MPAPPCCLYPSPSNAMQPEADVNMNTPMTEEEWAIWQALWRVPDFRRSCRQPDTARNWPLSGPDPATGFQH